MNRPPREPMTWGDRLFLLGAGLLTVAFWGGTVALALMWAAPVIQRIT